MAVARRLRVDIVCIAAGWAKAVFHHAGRMQVSATSTFDFVFFHSRSPDLQLQAVRTA